MKHVLKIRQISLFPKYINLFFKSVEWLVLVLYTNTRGYDSYASSLSQHLPCCGSECLRPLPPRPLHCGALFTKGDKAASQLNNLTLCTKQMTALRKYLVSCLPPCSSRMTSTFTTLSLKNKRKTTDKSRQREDRWHQGWPQLSKSKVITTT